MIDRRRRQRGVANCKNDASSWKPRAPSRPPRLIQAVSTVASQVTVQRLVEILRERPLGVAIDVAALGYVGFLLQPPRAPAIGLYLAPMIGVRPNFCDALPFGLAIYVLVERGRPLEVVHAAITESFEAQHFLTFDYEQARRAYD